MYFPGWTAGAQKTLARVLLPPLLSFPERNQVKTEEQTVAQHRLQSPPKLHCKVREAETLRNSEATCSPPRALTLVSVGCRRQEQGYPQLLLLPMCHAVMA